MFYEMSEAQRCMLQDAVAREDRILQPPVCSEGSAAQAVASQLLDAGWAKEIKATKGARIWRPDAIGGNAFALKLTAKGVKAITASVLTPIDPEAPVGSVVKDMAVPEARSSESEPLPASARAAADTESESDASRLADRAPRPGSKLDQVLVMLSADAGATIGELMAATGWLSHSTRAALTGLRQRGYKLSLARLERDGASVYRVVSRAGEAAE